MVLTGDGPRPRPPDDPAAARFVRAQEVAAGLYRYVGGDVGDFLYHAGIVSHLGLTAYLFNRGLDDAWCRDRLGLDVAKTLAFAHHLGLGCDCNRMAELAALLDRKSVVLGTSGSGRVGLGGSRILNKKTEVRISNINDSSHYH